MNQTQFFEDFEALPPKAQQELIDLMMRLKQHYDNSASKSHKNMQHDWDSVFGMWKDRKDLQDSTAYVRQLRQNAWRNKG